MIVIENVFACLVCHRSEVAFWKYPVHDRFVDGRRRDVRAIGLTLGQSEHGRKASPYQFTQHSHPNRMNSASSRPSDGSMRDQVLEYPVIAKQDVVNRRRVSVARVQSIVDIDDRRIRFGG